MRDVGHGAALADILAGVFAGVLASVFAGVLATVFAGVPAVLAGSARRGRPTATAPSSGSRRTIRPRFLAPCASAHNRWALRTGLDRLVTGASVGVGRIASTGTVAALTTATTAAAPAAAPAGTFPVAAGFVRGVAGSIATFVRHGRRHRWRLEDDLRRLKGRGRHRRNPLADVRGRRRFTVLRMG